MRRRPPAPCQLSAPLPLPLLPPPPELAAAQLPAVAAAAAEAAGAAKVAVDAAAPVVRVAGGVAVPQPYLVARPLQPGDGGPSHPRRPRRPRGRRLVPKQAQSLPLLSLPPTATPATPFGRFRRRPFPLQSRRTPRRARPALTGGVCQPTADRPTGRWAVRAVVGVGGSGPAWMTTGVRRRCCRSRRRRHTVPRASQ